MPKISKKRKEAKAKRLSKVYIENNLNASKTAKEIGVSPQAINKQINKPEVQNAMQEYLGSAKLTKKLKKVAMEGLEATKTISAMVIVAKNKPGSLDQDTPQVKELIADEKSTDFVDVPDHAIRYKFWEKLMEATGMLQSKAPVIVLSVDQRDSIIIAAHQAMNEGVIDVEPIEPEK